MIEYHRFGGAWERRETDGWKATGRERTESGNGNHAGEKTRTTKRQTGNEQTDEKKKKPKRRKRKMGRT